MPILYSVPSSFLKAWPTREFAIVDLEYTCWEGSLERSWSDLNEFREIIQIGSIIVERVPGGQIIEKNSFSCLVRPSKNPSLSEYCKSLTGISQQELDDSAVPFDKAVSLFCEFAASVNLIICNGNDGQVLTENFLIHDLALPSWIEKIRDFRPLLSIELDVEQSALVSSELPGSDPSTNAHNALSDCRSIRQALDTLFRNKEGRVAKNSSWSANGK